MALKFYILKVSAVFRETQDSVTLSFEIPTDLKEIFNYKHGQYITVKLPVNGEENRRAYSISSSPVTDSELSVTVKKVDEGKVSRYLNEEIKEGDILEVMPPLGNFTVELNSERKKNYILIGGGSGITPLMSILKTILAVEPQSIVYLIFQNRNESSIIFRNQLNELENIYKNRFFVNYILSKPGKEWQGLSGKLDSTGILQLIKKLIPDSIFKSEYFLCGPQGLMQESELALRGLLVASFQIHKESFAAAISKNDEIRTDNMLNREQDLKTRKVKIILYGDEIEFDVEPDETVLTAAQREGQDPPFSCQIGACSTCRARLKSGEVFMDERDSLTDEEIEEGYILTCQSHPLSDNVIIDYDDN
jgi:ring-1,2-phenylacetyl-CoA epoxidase subunit PaaE